MSQADALLNSLTDEDIAAFSVGGNEEPHIVIGKDRYITVPESLKRIAVQHDHNIETVTFDCPRYWDDYDLSEMIIYINYKLSDGFVGSYIAENISAEDDIIHFTWTITRTVTQNKGNIIFLVCAKSTDAEGNESTHWNTELNTDMYVSEGLETEVVVADEYPDIVNQLLERMTVVEGAESRMAEMADQVSAHADYVRETYANVNERVEYIYTKSDEIRNSYANAIKGTAEGEIVRIDDVSPLEHDVSVKVRGKNLVNVDYIDGESSSDRSIIQKDGETVIFPALDGNVYGFYISNADLGLEVGKTYTASIGSISAFNQSSYGWRLRYVDGTTATLDHANTATFTLEKELDKIIFRVGSPYTGNTESRIEDIQIEEGLVATEYTPYINPTTVTLSRYGKNVFNKNNYTTAYDNATINDQSDNVFDITGEEGGGALMYSAGALAIKIPQGLKLASKIAISLYVTLVEVGAYDNQLRYYAYNDTVALASETVTLTVGERTKITMICDNIGETMTRILFYLNNNRLTFEVDTLQIEYADAVSDFNECIETTYTPNTDGSVNVTSLSPTMTIFTDTDGASVEVEYNRDQHKVLGDLSAALDRILELQNSILEGAV